MMIKPARSYILKRHGFFLFPSRRYNVYGTSEHFRAVTDLDFVVGLNRVWGDDCYQIKVSQRYSRAEVEAELHRVLQEVDEHLTQSTNS